MSAADSHECSEDELHYEAVGVRQPYDDGTIRPILDRLSRGTSDGGGAARFASPPVDHAGRDASRGVRWALVVGCALCAGATAGLALAAFAWIAPVQSESPQPQTLDLSPKHVHTVSFKQEPASEGASIAAQPERSTQKQPHATAQVTSASATEIKVTDDAVPYHASKPAIGPKDLIALWSGVPADVAAQLHTAASPLQLRDATDGDKPAEANGAHHPHAQHKRHYARRHVGRSHRVRPSAAAPQTRDASAKPTETPLQSAWQALFGHPVNRSNPATHAAFQ